MDIITSLAVPWLKVMGIDPSKFKIIMTDKEFELAPGPTLFLYGNGKSNLSDEIERGRLLKFAREECCTICGVHLETHERNKKLRCTVCYFKKVDGK